MTTELFFSALLGLVLQGFVIYMAIRLALIHDRAAKVREVAKVAAAAKWQARADEARTAAAKAKADAEV